MTTKPSRPPMQDMPATAGSTTATMLHPGGKGTAVAGSAVGAPGHWFGSTAQPAARSRTQAHRKPLETRLRKPREAASRFADRSDRIRRSILSCRSRLSTGTRAERQGYILIQITSRPPVDVPAGACISGPSSQVRDRYHGHTEAPYSPQFHSGVPFDGGLLPIRGESPGGWKTNTKRLVISGPRLA